MIQSYGDSWTERFAKGQRVKQFEAFRRQAERALDRLDAAVSLGDIANFPGHRLEKLRGPTAPAPTASGSTTSGASASHGRSVRRGRPT
jgi:plasmid maintenance system killer protein